MKPEYLHLIESNILRDLLLYEKKKVPFADKLYEFSKKNKIPLTIKEEEYLAKILSQLFLDETTTIRQNAILAFANFTNNSDTFITKCSDRKVLEQMLNAFENYNQPTQMAIFSIIGSFCRLCKSEDVAYTVTKLKLVDVVLACLRSMDEHLIIVASRALYDMVLHIKIVLDLAKRGLFEILALIIMDDLPGVQEKTEPVITIVKRASELGQWVPHCIVKSGCLGLVSQFMNHPLIKYQKLALATIVNVGRSSLLDITSLFGPYLFCDFIACFLRDDPEMKYYAALLITKITETSKLMTRMLLENGLVCALLYSLQRANYSANPSLIALSNVISMSLEVTTRFIDLKGQIILTMLLYQDCCEFTVFSIIRIFTNIFERGDPYNTLIANLDIYPRLVEIYRLKSSSKQIRSAISNCCGLFLQNCTDWGLVKNFFIIAPLKLLPYVVRQFSEVLPTKLEERKAFLEMNGLEKVIRLNASPGTLLHDYVDIIKACFCRDIVNYYTPGFVQIMCDRGLYDNETVIKSIKNAMNPLRRNTSDSMEEDEDYRMYDLQFL